MRYDHLLGEAQRITPGSKRVLVALSTQPSVDELAAALALYLSLEQAGKEAAIVSEGVIRVGHTNLFGVGQIQNKLPHGEGGNLVITLGGVVLNGLVPALQKLDWYPQGQDLNLVFKVVPGQKFEPTHITPRFEGGSFDLIFTIGAPDLASLGTIYGGNQELFTNVHVVNLDNKSNSQNFGKTNVIDPVSSSLSEMVAQILLPLQLPYEGDIATNIISGIFAGTDNLQSSKVTAETFTIVAQAMQVGGKRPMVQPAQSAQVNQPVISQPQSPFPGAPVFPTSQPQPVQPVSPAATVGTPREAQPFESKTPSGLEQPSPEEQPSGEEVVTPEEDWLTPKIFKGSSIG